MDKKGLLENIMYEGFENKGSEDIEIVNAILSATLTILKELRKYPMKFTNQGNIEKTIRYLEYGLTEAH